MPWGMASAHPRPSKPPPCGIITVLNTPFTADAGEIDLKSLSNNVERAIDAGVAGFLVPALASEVSKLTAAEREAILRCVARTVASSTIDGPKHEAVSPEGESSGAGTRPAAAAQQPVVIGGASAATGSERMEAAATALDAGADAVLVNIPFNGDEAAWARDVRQVAGVVEAHGRGAWLCVQEWSGSDEGVPVAAIARLYDELPVFRSLKVEVVNATVKYSKLLEACPGLHVAGGWAVQQMIEALDRGVHAFMPSEKTARDSPMRRHVLHRQLVKLASYQRARLTG